MTIDEAELKALMLASLDGDSAAHRALLDRLSGRLRGYYKGKLARMGNLAAEVEDLVQEAVLAIHLKRNTYDTGEPSDAMGICYRPLQAGRLSAPDPYIARRCTDRRSG
jgi:hypothetical protein